MAEVSPSHKPVATIRVSHFAETKRHPHPLQLAHGTSLVGSCIDPLAPQAAHSFKDPDRSQNVGCITPPQTWHLTSVPTRVATNRPQLVHAPAGLGFLRAGTVRLLIGHFGAAHHITIKRRLRNSTYPLLRSKSQPTVVQWSLRPRTAEARVNGYRCYFLDSESHVHWASDFICGNDDEALARAQLTATRQGGTNVEIWNVGHWRGARLVWSGPPEALVNVGSAAAGGREGGLPGPADGRAPAQARRD